MTSNNFRFATILRVLVLTGLITIFLLVVLRTSWIVTAVILFFIICIAIYELLRYIEDSNRNFSDFLLSIRSEDFTKQITNDKRGKSFEQLKDAFNTIIEEFHSIRIAKEEQFIFLQAIVSNLNTSIICFDETGTIKLLNDAAKKLFHIPEIQNTKLLEKINPDLFAYLKNESNEVIEMIINEEQLKLLFRSTHFILQEQAHKLVIITNIKSEIDQAETEAWQQLLQVLTHEIMNSVTPISSLSETIKTEFDKMIEQETFAHNDLNELSQALTVIKNRSEGLISFVHQYKSLINLPEPKLKSVSISHLMDHIKLLTQQYLMGRNIKLVIISALHNITIYADEQMIEQVILNLLYNAADALQNTTSPTITIGCEERKDAIILTVSDNGNGIDKAIEDKIFIPFFTTRVNGTGVGLSLSKQIMRLHKGNISVQTSSKTGTSFSLSFPKI